MRTGVDRTKERSETSLTVSRPPVSAVLLTYRQERYVAESVRSALAQDYENFEIVISDDCSDDATWQIVMEEVERAKRRPGFRTAVRLNRNERNLGIVANFEKGVSLSTGEIIVGMAGDDVQEPFRVRRIVEAWTGHGDDVSALAHGVRTIDVNGRLLDAPLPWTPSFDHPLGAAVVYARKTISSFPPARWRGASEDNVYCQRARLVGATVTIPDELVFYRMGSGVTAFEDRDRHDKSVCQSEFYALLQTLDDVRFARRRWISSPVRMNEVRETAIQKSIWCVDTWLRVGLDIPLGVRARMFGLFVLALRRDRKNWVVRRGLVALLLPKAMRLRWCRRFGDVWSVRQLLARAFSRR